MWQPLLQRKWLIKGIALAVSFFMHRLMQRKYVTSVAHEPRSE